MSAEATEIPQVVQPEPPMVHPDAPDFGTKNCFVDLIRKMQPKKEKSVKSTERRSLLLPKRSEELAAAMKRSLFLLLNRLRNSQLVSFSFTNVDISINYRINFNLASEKYTYIKRRYIHNNKDPTRI